MNKDSIIVLSGGMDSVTMLHQYASAIALAVNFTYGSNHNARELECARHHCDSLGIELVVIDLSFIGELFHSSLLEGADAIPEGDYDFDNMKSTVVPFRNGIMLSAAAGLAESRGLHKILIAYDGITVEAPFSLMDKAQIAALGKELGIDYSTTYSCYKGGEMHCGVCGTCRERRQAMADAGIDDKTEYEQ